jgi:hypothetical protein
MPLPPAGGPSHSARSRDPSCPRRSRRSATSLPRLSDPSEKTQSSALGVWLRLCGVTETSAPFLLKRQRQQRKELVHWVGTKHTHQHIAFGYRLEARSHPSGRRKASSFQSPASPAWGTDCGIDSSAPRCHDIHCHTPPPSPSPRAGRPSSPACVARGCE